MEGVLLYKQCMANKGRIGLNRCGEPIIIPYNTDRLRSEAAMLDFLAKHTSIPVPRVLSLCVESDLVYLKTSLLPSNAVELSDLDLSLLPAAIEKVEKELESTIFPQRHSFRRNYWELLVRTFPLSFWYASGLERGSNLA